MFSRWLCKRYNTVVLSTQNGGTVRNADAVTKLIYELEVFTFTLLSGYRHGGWR